MSRRQWSQLLPQAAASRHDMARTFRTTARRRHAEAMRAPPQGTHPEALPPRAEQSAQPWNARAHRRRSAVQWKVATKNPSPSNEAPCDMRSLRFTVRHALASVQTLCSKHDTSCPDCIEFIRDTALCAGTMALRLNRGLGDSARLPCVRDRRPGRLHTTAIRARQAA